MSGEEEEQSGIDGFFHKIFDSKEQKQKRAGAAGANQPVDNFRRQNSKDQQQTGDARNIALNRNLKLFEPITALLERMYGPGFHIDLDQFKTSPLDEAMYGPGGINSAPIGSAVQGIIDNAGNPPLDIRNPQNWYQGPSVDRVPNPNGVTPGGNLAPGPVLPDDAKDWCQVCGFSPKAATHMDPNNPGYHPFVPPS